MAYNENNKHNMENTKLKHILIAYKSTNIELQQAHDVILRLFNVVGRSEQLVCPHCQGLEVYIDEYGGKPCKCTKQAN